MVGPEAGAAPTIKGAPGGGARSGSDRTGSGGHRAAGSWSPRDGVRVPEQRPPPSPHQPLLRSSAGAPASEPRHPRPSPAQPRGPLASAARAAPRPAAAMSEVSSGRACGGEAAAREPGSEGGRGNPESPSPPGAPHCPPPGKLPPRALGSDCKTEAFSPALWMELLGGGGAGGGTAVSGDKSPPRDTALCICLSAARSLGLPCTPRTSERKARLYPPSPGCAALAA